MPISCTFLQAACRILTRQSHELLAEWHTRLQSAHSHAVLLSLPPLVATGPLGGLVIHVDCRSSMLCSLWSFFEQPLLLDVCSFSLSL